MRKLSKKAVTQIARSLEHKCVYVATCSVQLACVGEHEFVEATGEAAAREMIKEGWLDDLIIDDGLHLACPSCVEQLKRDGGDFEELDPRLQKPKKESRTAI